MNKSTPLWRSLLYVPVNVERYVESAIRSEADAVQLDLEDSIVASEKDAARLLVPKTAERAASCGADVVVRINRPFSLAIRDIEVSVCPYVTALSLPKVESAEQVQLLSEVVSDNEVKAGMEIGATRLIVGVESPRAWFHMKEIAASDPRIAAMLLGGEDFVSSVGMSSEPEYLLGPKQTLVIAAASASILPLGLVGSFADYKDLDGLRLLARRSSKLGYRGSSCIHPLQAPVLNEEFAPKPHEIASAKEIVAQFDLATTNDVGAIGIGGKMIDLPIVERAKSLLALHHQIETRRVWRRDKAALE